MSIHPAQYPSHASGFAELKQSVVEHYESALDKHGPTARGMDWKDEASQQLRFAILTGICDLERKSIHEIGAGAGHLWDYLLKHGIEAHYSASDLSTRMVEAARTRHPAVAFHSWDILRESRLPTFDVVVTSGLFHVRLDRSELEWRSFVQGMIRRMYEICRIGIAFNLMTDQVDFHDKHLFYSHPAETLDFCRRELSPYVTIRHDYPLYEYTVYVYRNSAI